MEPFDMHIHSYYSDGTDSPTAIVRAAKVRGLKMISLTDHDSTLGVAEAAKAGEREGIKVLSGIEFNTVHPSELHILGWGFDMHNGMLKQTLDWLCGERERRNASMLAKLRTLQCDAAPYLEPIKGNLTRLHIANALVAGGYASSKGDAFERYLKKGRPAYVPANGISPEDAVRLIVQCGGLAAIAHPCHFDFAPEPLIRRLKSCGLGAIEAYYPSSTTKQTEYYSMLAERYELLITCGSDYHGQNRKAVKLGCAWRYTHKLYKAYNAFLEKWHESNKSSPY